MSYPNEDAPNQKASPNFVSRAELIEHRIIELIDEAKQLQSMLMPYSVSPNLSEGKGELKEQEAPQKSDLEHQYDDIDKALDTLGNKINEMKDNFRG